MNMQIAHLQITSRTEALIPREETELHVRISVGEAVLIRAEVWVGELGLGIPVAEAVAVGSVGGIGRGIEKKYKYQDKK